MYNEQVKELIKILYKNLIAEKKQGSLRYSINVPLKRACYLTGISRSSIKRWVNQDLSSTPIKQTKSAFDGNKLNGLHVFQNKAAGSEKPRIITSLDAINDFCGAADPAASATLVAVVHRRDSALLAGHAPHRPDVAFDFTDHLKASVVGRTLRLRQISPT